MSKFNGRKMLCKQSTDKRNKTSSLHIFLEKDVFVMVEYLTINI